MIPLSGDIPNSKGEIKESNEMTSVSRGTSTLKRGFAHMLKNGVVMDVTTVEQALIAEEAGAVSVMVLDKLPSDVRKAGGVASDVVKVTIFLTNIEDRSRINPIRQRYFGEHRPASTLIEVSQLVLPELKVEIEAEAVI